MSAMTLTEARELSGCDFYDYLDVEATIPTVTAAACQGDVSILRVTIPPAVTPIPAAGVVVASGQGGHDHTITGAGMFDRWDSRLRDDLTVGLLTVPEGATVLMTHQEHGAILFSAGTYQIGSQREYAGQWRAVAD